MVITQTPLRVSFFGGGTDFKDYYEEHGGCVLSATIDKYLYVLVKPRYLDRNIVLHYPETEKVSHPEEISHPIFREAIKMAGITEAMEILTTSDIPLSGTGLGSFSALAVGLIAALFAFKKKSLAPFELAELACHLEIDLLEEPIGKQDQYAVAFGGFNKYFFTKDEVEVKKLKISLEGYKRISSHALIFYTGLSRKSSSVLKEQKANISKNIATLHFLKEMVLPGEEALLQQDSEAVGRLLHLSWERKKMLCEKIQNEEIEKMYALGMQAGSYGGKLLGAGGGGFMLFFSNEEKKEEIRSALKNYCELHFVFQPHGSRVLCTDREEICCAL